MRIVLDRSLCDGNGLCAGHAPQYFQLDTNDELEILQEQVSADDLIAVDRAIDSCPKAALRIGGDRK